MSHAMSQYTCIRVRKEVADRYRQYCEEHCLAVGRYAEYLLQQAMAEDQPSPWEVSTQARRDWLAFKGLPETPDTLARAVEELGAAGLDALAAERTRRRLPMQMDSGMLRYRGPAPERLILMVLHGSIVAVVPQPGPPEPPQSPVPARDAVEYLA